MHRIVLIEHFPGEREKVTRVHRLNDVQLHNNLVSSGPWDFCHPSMDELLITGKNITERPG